MVFDTVDSWLAVQPVPKQLIWALPQPINGDLFGCSENCQPFPHDSHRISLTKVWTQCVLLKREEKFALNCWCENNKVPWSICDMHKKHLRFLWHPDFSTFWVLKFWNWNLVNLWDSNLIIGISPWRKLRRKRPVTGWGLEKFEASGLDMTCRQEISFGTLFSLLWLAFCCCSCRERLLDVKQEAILSWFLKNSQGKDTQERH